MHTTANCYWPGGGKEGQFPPNFRQRTKANIVNSTTGQTSTAGSQPTTEHFALLVRILNTPGYSRVLIEDDPAPHPHMDLIRKGFQRFNNGKVPTFMDLAASNTMFVSRDAFTNYLPTS